MRTLLIVVFLSLFSFTEARAGDGFSAYAAVGENLRPFSFRLGYADWEVGQLNGLYGFGKVFHMNEYIYAGLGFAFTTSVGLYSAIGVATKLWVIPVRIELASIMDAKGLTQSGGLIGVTYGF